MNIYPLSTEKAIRMLEAENKIAFVVDRKATKEEIKKEIEKLFNAKVVSINKLTDRRSGNMRVYVRFAEETPAIDIATKLGMM